MLEGVSHERTAEIEFGVYGMGVADLERRDVRPVELQRWWIEDSFATVQNTVHQKREQQMQLHDLPVTERSALNDFG